MRIALELTEEQGERLLMILARLGDQVRVTTDRPPTEPKAAPPVPPNGHVKTENLTHGRMADTTRSRKPDAPPPTLDDLKMAIVQASVKLTPDEVTSEVERLTGVRRASLVPANRYQELIDRLQELSEKQ